MIFNPQNGMGLVVTNVDPDGQAAQKKVQVGDTLVEVNGKSIPEGWPDPALAEILFGLPRPITLGFKANFYPSQKKKTSAEQRAAAAAGFSEVAPGDFFENTGTPLKTRESTVRGNRK